VTKTSNPAASAAWSNSPFRSSALGAATCVLQDGTHLFTRHAGKPLDKLVDGRIVFEILEQCGDGYACTAEHPGSAIPFRVLFDRKDGIARWVWYA
jgi:hypothetical protein